MTAADVEAIIGCATFALTFGTTLYVMGRKHAKLEARIESKASRDEVSEVKSQLNVMSITLGEIKGMFTLKLKD